MIKYNELQSIFERHMKKLEAQKLSKKTINSKYRAISDFLLHVGVVMAMTGKLDDC